MLSQVSHNTEKHYEIGKYSYTLNETISGKLVEFNHVPIPPVNLQLYASVYCNNLILASPSNVPENPELCLNRNKL